MTDEDVKAAKKAVTVNLSEQLLNPEATVEAFGQALILGETVPAESLQTLDMISVGDVQVSPYLLSGITWSKDHSFKKKPHFLQISPSFSTFFTVLAQIFCSLSEAPALKSLCI